MERKIRSQLRAHNRARRSSNGADSREYSSSSHEEEMEELKDFTLEEIEKLLIDDGIILDFYGLIGQGKEANVYWAKTPNNRLSAIKAFRIHTTSHNFNSLHARAKLSDTAKLNIATDLCRKEYINLNFCQSAGVRVPAPGEHHEFIYTMDFLGDHYGPSPLLREVNLKRMPGGKDFVIEMMDEILDQLDLMFNKAEMVHGDFSEHNIVFHNMQPYIIDFLQSERWHPKYDTPERIRKRDAIKVLKKDINTILNYFNRNYGLTYDPQTVFEVIAGDVEDWEADELLSEFADPELKKQEEQRVRIED